MAVSHASTGVGRPELRGQECSGSGATNRLVLLSLRLESAQRESTSLASLQKDTRRAAAHLEALDCDNLASLVRHQAVLRKEVVIRSCRCRQAEAVSARPEGVQGVRATHAHLASHAHVRSTGKGAGKWSGAARQGRQRGPAQALLHKAQLSRLQRLPYSAKQPDWAQAGTVGTQLLADLVKV